MTSFKRL